MNTIRASLVVLVVALLVACAGLPDIVLGPAGGPIGQPVPQPQPGPAPGGQPSVTPGTPPVDPFKRGPTLEELDLMASVMLSYDRTGTRLSGRIVEDPQRSGGVAAISFGGGDSIIYVDPQKRREWSVNTWAFIIGHELCHALLQHRSGGGPEQEWEADQHGAALADAAGYYVEGYINFICTQQPNACSRSHGCFHDRMRRLEDQFSVDACPDGGHSHQGHRMAIGAAPSTSLTQPPPASCIVPWHK